MEQLYLIYLATNLINGKQYVGQTKDFRLERRIYEHLLDAEAAKKHNNKNVAFHNAILKYGLDNFTFEIIETDIAEKYIDEREKYWIAYHNTYIHAENSNGYNETIGGQGTHGYVFTEADRQRMSQKLKAYWKELKETDKTEYDRLCKIRSKNLKGKAKSTETREKLRQAKLGSVPWNKGKFGLQSSKFKDTSTLPNILMFDLQTGVLVNTFVSVQNAVRSLWPELNKSDISTKVTRIASVCKLNKGHAYGYIWRYKQDKYEQLVSLEKAELELEHKSPKAKAVQQFNLSGDCLAEFESAACYAKTVTDDYKQQRHIAKAISEVCRGNRKIYGGFVWKYKNID